MKIIKLNRSGIEEILEMDFTVIEVEGAVLIPYIDSDKYPRVKKILKDTYVKIAGGTINEVSKEEVLDLLFGDKSSILVGESTTKEEPKKEVVKRSINCIKCDDQIQFEEGENEATCYRCGVICDISELEDGHRITWKVSDASINHTDEDSCPCGAREGNMCDDCKSIDRVCTDLEEAVRGMSMRKDEYICTEEDVSSDSIYDISVRCPICKSDHKILSFNKYKKKCACGLTLNCEDWLDEPVYEDNIESFVAVTLTNYTPNGNNKLNCPSCDDVISFGPGEFERTCECGSTVSIEKAANAILSKMNKRICLNCREVVYYDKHDDVVICACGTQHEFNKKEPAHLSARLYSCPICLSQIKANKELSDIDDLKCSCCGFSQKGLPKTKIAKEKDTISCTCGCNLFFKQELRYTCVDCNRAYIDAAGVLLDLNYKNKNSTANASKVTFKASSSIKEKVNYLILTMPITNSASDIKTSENRINSIKEMYKDYL